MARISESLPERFPVGTKYVVECRGPLVCRYVEFPDGHKVILAKRKALSRNTETSPLSVDRIGSRKSDRHREGPQVSRACARKQLRHV